MVLLATDAAAQPLIRRATLADLTPLRALLERYFTEGRVQYTDSHETLRHKLADPTLGFSVAEQNGQLLGCVMTHELPAPPSACECKRLYVPPEHRGRRIASRLMDFVEQQARDAGFTWLYLDTKDDFPEAIALYSARGYTSCERYNDNPQATLFFRKPLQPA